jgi:predicted N-acetyltransferase YhbS
MGKIFPLSEKPSYLEETLELIEKSFQYNGPFRFEIDFAPLIDKSNHHNCYIFLDENERVIAHVGAKDRTLNLNGRSHRFTLLGGIAVDKDLRGTGIFKELFQEVLDVKKSSTSFFLLWSELEKLYNKFGFFLCGNQFEKTQQRANSPFQKTKFISLSIQEKEEIKSLYKDSFSRVYLTPERSVEDWKLIEMISSADLYLRKEGLAIQDYYVMGKGQDLTDIIYEYGSKNNLPELINNISCYGKVWMGTELVPCQNIQYQFFMRPGDLGLFTDLIFDITQKKFSIRNINFLKEEIYFDFEGETLSLKIQDFLRGIFGPGIFEELEVIPFFISGLDSI